MAGKRLTAADVAQRLAEKTGLSVEQVKAVLTAQAELAFSETAQASSIPGIGVLSKIVRPAREMVMRFGPRAGQKVTIPPTRKLKFSISPIAKQMVFGPPKPMPELFKPIDLAQFEFSFEATELTEPSMFISGLGGPFTAARDGKQVQMVVYRLPDLRLTTGRILAADPMFGIRDEPLSRAVPPGSYPLAVAMARVGVKGHVALAIIRFSSKPAVRWELAVRAGQDISKFKEGQFFGYGVDSGRGCFSDASVARLVIETTEADMGFYEQVEDAADADGKKEFDWVHIESPNGSMAVFSSGEGDGAYPSYFGLDESGEPAVLVTDFKIVNWAGVR